MSDTITAQESPPIDPNDEFLGHPKGLYVCFFTEMWERFSFYGMKALLFLYLIQYHLFTDEHGYNLLAAYGAMVYALPVIGGLLADRYIGMRKAVIFGAVLLVLGHLGMAYEGHQASLTEQGIVRDQFALQVFYFSLALISMGVGFLKSNISTIVGRLYSQHDPRRDSGFTIFYAGINVGAWIAPLICAYLGQAYGWQYGFGLAGIGMLAGLLVFIFGQKHFQGRAEPRHPERLAELKFGLSVEKWIYLGATAGIFLVWGLIQTHSLVLYLADWLPEFSPVIWFMHITSVLLFGSIIWYLTKYCTKEERHQMSVLFTFIIAGLVFFGLYEQTYGSWVTFSERVMDRNTFGIEWTSGQLVSTGAMFILILTPFFAWLWPMLARRNLNPSKPMKMTLGLFFAGCSFLILVWATNSPGESGLVSVWFLILAYFILELGELCLSPIGLSAVTQLSVKKIVGLMMGAWFLGAMAYAQVVASELGKLSSIETVAGQSIDVVEALTKYEDAFLLSAKLGLGAAIVFFLLTPILKKLMHDNI